MRKARSQLVFFVIITLASGWLGVLLDTYLTEQPEGDTLGMGLWLVLPPLAALVLRIACRDWEDAGLLPRFKVSIKWYVVSLLVFPTLTVVTLGVAGMVGVVALSEVEITTTLPLVAAGFGVGLIKNVFEEFAWRGYLVPKLIRLNASDWSVYIISGLVWALWHVPYYLVFLGDGVFESLHISRVGFVLVGIVVMVCWNVMYVELLRITKSIWPGILMHAAEDAVPAFLFSGGYYAFVSSGYAWLFDPNYGAIIALACLVIGLKVRRIRINASRSRAEY